MKLNVGESKTVKLRIWLKAIDFDCAGNSLRLEASRGSMWLYANNGSRKHFYCAIYLGGSNAMRKQQYTIKAQSKSRVLFSVGQVKFVIDFAAKKAATNLVGYRIAGSKEWGENCQIPWRADFLPLFGMPMPPAEMDRSIAELFWKWFLENENAIKTQASGGRKEVKNLAAQLDLWMGPMFLYEKCDNFDIKLICGEQENRFIFNPGENEQLRADAAALGELMPPILARDWKFILED